MVDEEVSLRVAIRVRPLKATEGSCAWRYDCDDGTVALLGPDGEALTDKKSSFRYDAVFGERAPTSEIYDAVVRELVDGVLKGFNGTVFAYGQTAAGKTYTMQGGGEEDGGVMTMAAEQIFSGLAATADTEFLLRCSYLEVYNETVRDLLGGDGSEVHIREDPKRGVFVEGATEENVTDVRGVIDVLQRGERERHVGETAMNERSSRSHTVFRLVVESKAAGDDGIKVGALSLVDLAGSESVRLTGAVGQRAKEGGKINQSLLTLSLVVKQLGERGSGGGASHGGGGFVNYRDSKLTRLLQPTLGGDARLAMVCCVAPADRYVEETRSTLQFGARAAKVTLAPKVQEVLDDASQLRRVKRQLAELQKKQREYEEGTAAATTTTTTLGQSGKTEELSKLLEANAQLEEAVEGKKAQLRLQREKMEKLARMIVLGGTAPSSAKGHITTRGARGRTKRARETWAPGAMGGGAAALPFRFGAKSSLTAGGSTDSDDEDGERGSPVFFKAPPPPLGALAEEPAAEGPSPSSTTKINLAAPEAAPLVLTTHVPASPLHAAPSAEVLELREALDKAEAALEEARADAERARAERVDAPLTDRDAEPPSAELLELRETLEASEAALKDARADVDAERARADHLGASLTDRDADSSAELLELREMVETVEAALKDARADADAERARAERLDAFLTDRDAEPQSAELLELREMLEAVEAALKDSRADVDAERARADQLDAYLRDRDANTVPAAELLELRETLETVEVALKVSRADVDAERARTERLDACLGDCVASLRAECEASDDELARRSVPERATAAPPEETAEDPLGALCFALSAQRARWAEALDVAMAERSAAQSEAYCMKQEVVELRESSELFEQQFAAVEDELEAARAAADQARADLADAHAKTHDDGALRDADRGAELDRLAQLASSLKAELAVKDARIDRLEQVKMTTEIFRKIQQMQVEKARAEGENAELREQVRCLEAELSGMPESDAAGPRTTRDADSPLRAAAAALVRGSPAPASVAARLQLDELAARNADLAAQLDDARDVLEAARASAISTEELDALGAPTGESTSARLRALAAEAAAQLRGVEGRYEAARDECARLDEKLRAAEARATAAEKSHRSLQTPAGRRAQNDAAALQEKIEFLERENLALMLEIKETAKAATRHKSEAEVLRAQLENGRAEKNLAAGPHDDEEHVAGAAPSSRAFATRAPPTTATRMPRSALKSIRTKTCPLRVHPKHTTFADADKENFSNRLGSTAADEAPPECHQS